MLAQYIWTHSRCKYSETCSNLSLSYCTSWKNVNKYYKSYWLGAAKKKTSPAKSMAKACKWKNEPHVQLSNTSTYNKHKYIHHWTRASKNTDPLSVIHTWWHAHTLMLICSLFVVCLTPSVGDLSAELQTPQLLEPINYSDCGARWCLRCWAR